MDKNEVYRLLEEKILSYQEYLEVEVKECGEPMVNLSARPYLKTRQIDPEAILYTGENIFVRESVAEMLALVDQLLQETLPDHTLEVYYGYRALETQRKLFRIRKEVLSLRHFDNEMELLEAVHRMVAVPEVAGHPTGGAVDLTILDPEGTPLEMGTKPRDFIKDTYTFSPFISREAWNNRLLLRRLMTTAGFAPFDGEWWHFSYGDKEWAKFYNRPFARYQQIDLPKVVNGHSTAHILHTFTTEITNLLQK